VIRPLIDTITSFEQWQLFKQTRADYEWYDVYQELHFAYFCQTDAEARFAAKEDQQRLYHQAIKHSDEAEGLFSAGVWVTLPWRQSCYHFLSPDQMYHLRTLRNQGLVTNSEQQRLRTKKIGIIGLSVGKTVALSLVRFGIGSHFVLADNDVVDVTNTNRAFYDLTELGRSKLDLTAEKMFQLDPFLSIDQHSKMIDHEALQDFMDGCDLVIDTFDTFPVKLALRQLAKEKKIPVLSGVDLDRGMLLILERYDLDSELDTSLFLNRLDPSQLMKGSYSKKEVTDFFIQMIGHELHSERLLKTVKAVGEKYTSYPQLIVASQLFSAVMVYIAELVLLGTKTESFRSHIDLQTIFAPYLWPNHS
jgi:hypothetical protein